MGGGGGVYSKHKRYVSQRQGSAAAIRNKVSAAFRDSVNIVDGGASLVPEMIANPSGVVVSSLVIKYAALPY